ncbi:4-hydroxy-tetrahydrodipicolinate reductase [Govanella unica]|uniref:4-hydroxy-tetrahydrodipicolinate reductase n=1 Tax=Govanella unica TaxID=2975056 RepID=A0A9X3U058_9PROT|nr:4-hydroxy-tetrahydrodipicolinate reductase [Govania unica]MDA5194662.1 4-hydroxy-tetrahydrodipicolinate reductase [Govania unica]
MSRTRIGILGCAGRMGRTLIAEVLAQSDRAELAGGVDQPASPALGKPILDPVSGADTGLVVGSDPHALFAISDVVIDFTCPTASVMHAQEAARTGTALIIGTTGLAAHEDAEVARASAGTAIVQAANFSLGVNLLVALTEQVSRLLNDDFDVEVLEMHHRMKVDAPSGTALALGKAAAAGRGVDLEAVADRVRDGITGARTRGHIGFATLRGGNVVGDHTVIFAADNERIELSHKAGDRAIFARGAVAAALWAHGKPAGQYGMNDVLGFTKA